MLLPFDKKMEVKLRIVLDSSHKLYLEVCQLEKVKVVHLLLDSVSNLCFNDFIFDKYLSHCLVLLVGNVDFARKTTSVLTIQGYFNECFSEAKGLCYLILGEMNSLSFFQFDKLNFKRFLLPVEGEDKCFFPDEILILCGGFAISFGAVISQPAVN